MNVFAATAATAIVVVIETKVSSAVYIARVRSESNAIQNIHAKYTRLFSLFSLPPLQCSCALSVRTAAQVQPDIMLHNLHSFLQRMSSLCVNSCVLFHGFICWCVRVYVRLYVCVKVRGQRKHAAKTPFYCIQYSKLVTTV